MMLTYAAVKFTCEPRNVYVIRSSEHLHFRKKFFVGKLMCTARWKCKRICLGSEQHPMDDDEDDFRPAEVLLMGNSRKNIITMLQQYYPKLTVIESKVSHIKFEETNEEQKKKRKRNELDQSMHFECHKKLKLEQECENDENQLDRTDAYSDESATITPSKRRVQINEVPSPDDLNISFKDLNEYARIADIIGIPY